MPKNNRNLAEDFKHTLDELREGHSERRNSIKKTLGEAHEVLADTRGKVLRFREGQKQAAHDLKKFLNKYKLSLTSENFNRVKDFKNFFQRLSNQNNVAAIELKGFLKKYHLDLKKENMGRLKDFLGFFDDIRDQVQTMHQSYQNFQEQMTSKRNRPLYLRPVSSPAPRRVGKKRKMKSKTKKHKKKK